jgi:hypothetical protein
MILGCSKSEIIFYKRIKRKDVMYEREQTF